MKKDRRRVIITIPIPQSIPNIQIHPLENNTHVSKVHCGSAFEPGTSGLPYYCTPPVCVPAVIGALAVWRYRAVFRWRKPCREAGKVTYQDRHSTINNSVRDAIRRGAAENEVQKHEEKLTGAWRLKNGAKVMT